MSKIEKFEVHFPTEDEIVREALKMYEKDIPLHIVISVVYRILTDDE